MVAWATSYAATHCSLVIRAWPENLFRKSHRGTREPEGTNNDQFRFAERMLQPRTQQVAGRNYEKPAINQRDRRSARKAAANKSIPNGCAMLC